MGVTARIIGLAAMALATAAASDAGGESTSLPATRDARIAFDAGESANNGGQSARLRARQLAHPSGECVIMDFDHGAIASFVKAHRGKHIAVKLVLWSLGVGNAPKAKLDAATLDSAVDWNEGLQTGTAAAKGEVCATAAQSGTTPWTKADGKPVADLRDVFYDKLSDRVTTLANTASATIAETDNGKQVELELDAKFVEHLALDPKCRGVVLFTRDKANVDFSSREQHGKAPELVLTATK